MKTNKFVFDPKHHKFLLFKDLSVIIVRTLEAMESNLVLAFVNETNCDDETAYTYLQSHCWNINAALESWRYLHVISSGNSEVNQDNERSEVKKLSREFQT
ncbi:hypothetical protein CBL_13932 [Carabus blaptoides fortunei]